MTPASLSRAISFSISLKPAQGKTVQIPAPRLIELFQVLDTPEDQRQKTRDEDLTQFPYVNGDLFNEPLRIPAFDSAMRRILLDACNFDWSNISPAIFGALFQSIMDPGGTAAR